MNYFLFQIMRTIVQSATYSFSNSFSNQFFRNNYKNNYQKKNRQHCLEMKEKKENRLKTMNDYSTDNKSNNVLPSSFTSKSKKDVTPYKTKIEHKKKGIKRRYMNQQDILNSIL